MNDMTGAFESKINPNMVNHPLTAERIKNVRDKIAQMKYEYTPNKKHDADVNARYELVRAKLIGYLDNPAHVLELYPKSDKSSPAIYARAIANMNGGDLDTAKIGTGTLISRDPKNPYFYELLGDIEYQYGHFDDSVDAYKKSLELHPNAPQIQTALALVLSDRNKPGDNAAAIELCKRAILAAPMPLTYWILSRLYTDGKSDWAMAEFYNMQGKSSDAKKYAKRAQSKLPKSSPEYIKSGDILK
jgi:predicted Zn-dependent protease